MYIPWPSKSKVTMVGIDNFLLTESFQQLFRDIREEHCPDFWFQYELLTPNSLGERSIWFWKSGITKCSICKCWVHCRSISIINHWIAGNTKSCQAHKPMKDEISMNTRAVFIVYNGCLQSWIDNFILFSTGTRYSILCPSKGPK